MKNLCVLGLGYIGLPTATMFASHGYQVLGIDVNPRIVSRLNNGGVHIEEPGLTPLVEEALKSGSLRVAGQPQPADAFIIAVPTPIGEREQEPASREATRPRPEADLHAVMAAAESLVPHLRAGNLVILESTVPPRTTEGVLSAILNRSGVQDLLIAHCPERVLPGRILDELVGNDRVIGGVTQRAAEAAKALYASFVKGEILLTDATTAEMAKLMENTYRDVNIALANEFAQVAERAGIDVWEAIGLANRHPRVRILQPGPGVGGHCIAVDPWFIVETAPEVTPLIQTARRVNDSMPGHVVELVRRAVAGVELPVIACLGLTYKADIDDIRESPALQVIDLLRAEGFQVRACDPHAVAIPGLCDPLLSLAEALRGADCMLILTDHSEFRRLQPEDLKSMRRPVVLDTRHALRDLAIRQSAGYHKLGWAH